MPPECPYCQKHLTPFPLPFGQYRWICRECDAPFSDYGCAETAKPASAADEFNWPESIEVK
jgi:predicted amidophosphoribosyltransferase